MNTNDISQTPVEAATRFSHALRVVCINLTIWLLICTIGAAGNYQDSIHGIGEVSEASFLRIWLAWINGHVPLCILSSGLYVLLSKYPDWIASSRQIVRMYVVLALLFFPLHIAYIATPSWYKHNAIHSFVGFGEHILTLDNFTWFLEFAWFTGTFAVTIAIKIWYLGQERMHLLQQSQQANLELNLNLEQQRLRSLRQQLEPHFIFNALNAISALVRVNEKSIALHGINKLSELLRFALKASNTDVLRFSEEVQFLNDYLSLQGLRYGERLQYQITGLSPEIARGDCPPLLLQPLVENALRHDLDCHDEVGRIEVDFFLTDGQVHIRVSNTLEDPSSRNPGLGLGLTQSRERLRMMYGELGNLSVEQSTKHFCVNIRMPLYKPEQTK